jgi:hypothetical protein
MVARQSPNRLLRLAGVFAYSQAALTDPTVHYDYGSATKEFVDAARSELGLETLLHGLPEAALARPVPNVLGGTSGQLLPPPMPPPPPVGPPESQLSYHRYADVEPAPAQRAASDLAPPVPSETRPSEDQRDDPASDCDKK